MNSPIISLVVLAAIAVFLILRLRSVLGTREGFEKPPQQGNIPSTQRRHEFEVIEGGPDRDITDHVDEGSDAAEALAAMKGVERDFSVSDFLSGARGAYEMILMAFENGDIEDVRGFLDADVADAFTSVIDQRADQGLSIEATFVGVREVSLVGAIFNRDSGEAELIVRFVGELTSVVKDLDGNVVEGDPNEIKRQRDVWTFARKMGADDPNWALVATDG